ncbi:uncharacterized protein LOC132696912 isoform X3 [Cylas formicarius]|uniref:uncharacterized protein LOC132696912 isoform X3 n=1 Tax=Cylas formicarius TaxID=197179 RepID=UPI002958359E|nr:uncharacterized protein LOC132696912 isoform X3 [Cylas formicarius]
MAAGNELFYHTRFMLLLCGIWRLEIKNAPAYCRNVYPIYSVIIQTCNSLTPILLGANLPTLFCTNITAAFETLTKFLFSSLLALKMSMCQMKTLCKLIEMAIAKESNLYNKAHKNDLELEMIYKRHIRSCNRLTKFFYVCACGGAVLHWEFGIVDSYKIYRLEKYSNSTLNKPLPLHFWYPFDEDKFYIWALVHQLAQILLTALSQLKILQENFRNFHKFGGTQSWQNNPFRSLRMVCLKHQEFIVYVNDLNQWIKPLILMEYGTSSVMFAGAVIQVMAGVNVAFNGLFVFVLCGQLILLAWNCNEILIESGHLANALYESTWYEQDVKTKVLIHFMILRCQRSLGLTIGSFGPMTINAALSRLKLAYSYTSLMTGDENR